MMTLIRKKALTHLDSTSKDQIASNSRSHGRERRADLDNLRTFLTALVIVHHTAIAYGGVGGWKFKSRCFPPFSIGLAAFNGVDQTFFMGTFFYLSGRFAQQGLSRIQTNEIWLAFIRSRLLRLLLPAVVYTLTTEPTMTVMNDFFSPDAQATKIGVVGIAVHITSVFWAHLIQLRGINGPVWYCVLLTIFDIITSLAIPAYVWSTVHNSIKSRKRRMLPILWTSVILMSFLIRLVYPAGTSIALLNIQPAWLPQYIIAYTWGHLSLLSHDPYLLTPNPSQRRPVILLTCALCFCVVCLGGVIVISIVLAPSDSIEDVVRSMAGGFNVPALLYAVWNELSFVTIAPSLISVFAQHLNTPFCIKSRDGRNREFARYSYASFLLHPPVSMVVELVVERMMVCSLGPLSSAWIIWLGPGPAWIDDDLSWHRECTCFMGGWMGHGGICAISVENCLMRNLSIKFQRAMEGATIIILTFLWNNGTVLRRTNVSTVRFSHMWYSVMQRRLISGTSVAGSKQNLELRGKYPGLLARRTPSVLL